MKDNYSWLDSLMGWYERDGETWQPKSWEMSEDLNVTNVKQTIISQIEIEKLRAIEDFIKWHNNKVTNPTITFEQFNEYVDLQKGLDNESN